MLSSKQPKQNWSQALLELDELEELEEELELEELEELELEELEEELDEELDEELELELLELLPQFCALEHLSVINIPPILVIILPLYGVNMPPVA